MGWQRPAPIADVAQMFLHLSMLRAESGSRSLVCHRLFSVSGSRREKHEHPDGVHPWRE
jgi:hypothetical protein